MSTRDAHHMSQAVRMARRGLGLAWPNPAVGAIVVAPTGEIVGRGWTRPAAGPMPKPSPWTRGPALARQHALRHLGALRP
ncbi:hypothetical protein [Methyloceanibacter methanicus]|uniref:hypothetical protein n=1 Tax=Methyloceanibacter methanicus TaxID=1774968 RepID=UPI001FCD2976|nr:hypothetical protein [Methyloceanibacter methanicus]